MALSTQLESLQVEGRFLVGKESHRQYILRGVNRSGMEYRPTGCGGITEAEIATLVQEYGCRIIRIPFNQEWALQRAEYREQLQEVAQWINSRGAYMLLDLQWIDDRPRGGTNRVPSLPNPDSSKVWDILSASFRNSPGVLFDLFNEPHDPLPGDPFPLVRPDGTEYPEQNRVSAAMWREWALHLTDVIRDNHPSAVCFVSGLDWGYDLSPFPLDRPNLVYSTHVYRARGTQWRQGFGQLAQTHCVFAGEWGGEARDLAWGTRLADYLEELEMGWTAWSWTDHPRLHSARGLTPFGRIVADRLAG